MEYQVQENCLTIYLPAEVDHHNAEEMKRKADKLIDRNHIKYVIFDFENTDFMDSSGIGVIMGRYKTISLIGGEVWAVHTNERRLCPRGGSGVYDAVESDGRGGCRCENRRVGSCDKRHYPRI